MNGPSREPALASPRLIAVIVAGYVSDAFSVDTGYATLPDEGGEKNDLQHNATEK